MDPMSFMSLYYGSMAVVYTWTGEIHGYHAIGNFNTVDPVERKYIPDPSLKRTNRGKNSVGTSAMTWMNLKPMDQLDDTSYAAHGDIRIINVPLSTQTERLEDVRTEEEEVAKEEKSRQFVTNYVFICNI
jgi:hypothetical protein